MDKGDSRKHDRGGGRGWRGNNRGRNRFHNSNYHHNYESYEGNYGSYQGHEDSSQKDEYSYQNYDNNYNGKEYYNYSYEQDYKPRGRGGRGGRRGDYKGYRGGYRTSRGRQRRNEYNEGEQHTEDNKSNFENHPKTSHEQKRQYREYQRRENQPKAAPAEAEAVEEAKIYYNPDDFIIKYDKLPEKTEYLIRELCQGSILCSICHNDISQISAIWNCKQCFQPLHLGCIRRWIKKVNAEAPVENLLPFENRKEEIDENEHDFIEGRMEVKMGKNGELKIEQATSYTWTCPNCAYNYTESMPKYYCFCRKELNPDPSSYYLPHSCSKVCNKLKNQLCNHTNCNLECHPGACIPCEELVTVSCYCGKATREVTCHVRSQKQNFCCQDICGKSLECFNHICEEICHEGNCHPCKEKEIIPCYCEKKEIEVECGSSGASCHSICGKTLNCGNHTCTRTCHFGDCGECERLPEKIKLCPCGKTTLRSLNPNGYRKSCIDEIPTCKAICGKLLPCGTHHCRKRCHEGPCPLCEVQCTEICRCGKGERKKKCYELHYPIDNVVIFGEEILKSVQQLREKPFRCIKKCNKLKRCKKHRCQNLCCDVVSLTDPSGAHICLDTCGKDLACGKHKCLAFCHIDACEPCAVYSNVPLSCPCGLTVIPAPVRCGEKPFCFKKCRKIHKECGHTCGQQCHTGPCPSCTEGVSKACLCGKEKLDNVKCGELQPSCGQICNKVLPCGHNCKKMCHDHQLYVNSGEIDNGCGQKCNKKRKNCKHKCQVKCHGMDECPDLPCEAEVKVYCKCKYRYITSICNRYFEGFIEEEAKTIECNSECIKNKRDAQIAKAFSNKDELKQKELRADYYPEALIEFAKENLKLITKLEKIFEEIIRTKGFVSLPDIETSMRKYVSMLAKEHYGLDLCSYGGRKGSKPVTDVYFKEEPTNSQIPATLLSDYVKLINKGIVSGDADERKSKLFEASIKLTELPIGFSLDDLKRNLIGFHSEFYTEKIGTKGGFYLHFYNKYRAEEAFNKLRNNSSGFSYLDLIDHTNPETKKKTKAKKKNKEVEFDFEGFREV